jgi:hypothetical protein
MIAFSRVDDYKAPGIRRQGRGRAVLPGMEEIKGLSIVLQFLLFDGFPRRW